MTQTPLVQSRHAELVEQGRAALLQGDKAQAQALLNEALTLDPHSEEAWMWLSGAYTSPADMAACLQQVLTINPENEQAIEGLRWIETEHQLSYLDVSQSLLPETTPPSVSFQPRRPSERSMVELAEAALHPLAAGAFLGLLRLVTWLRPTTLATIRSDGGPMGTGASISIVLATVVVHAVVLIVIWLALGIQLSRIRVHDRGNRFDSLVRAGQLWMPGYLWGIALAVVSVGLGLSPGPWRVVSIICWLLLLSGAALILRGLWRLLRDVGLPRERFTPITARLVFSIVIAAVIGLGLAGIATAALLS